MLELFKIYLIPKQAVGCDNVGSVLKFQSRDVFMALIAKAGTAVATGSSGPASMSKTFCHELSLNLLAIIGPATPAPTIIKSNLKT